ncbi:hypothetical protein EDD27_7791 [Nonomuraea polychroma]|uniref:Uncharacterized protein n=1 Tax=Nonomuraea polychroma TaxID=46176 RepID=A0A438MHR8_9ACTN|nr:hypothetical protein [Nonomuraea polychroma]RVX45015.1 hypothetical protein EDD27_7791 [Nonomuraea polychroma]
MTIIDASPLGVAGPSAPTTVHLSGEIDIFTSEALRRWWREPAEVDDGRSVTAAGQ